MLFRGQMLELAGRRPEARATFQSLARNASALWYGDLARLLGGEARAAVLRRKAALHPIGGLTLEVALGLRAEAEKRSSEAIEHYRNALESGHSQWMEYTLAEERLLALREKQNVANLPTEHDFTDPIRTNRAIRAFVFPILRDMKAEARAAVPPDAA